MEELVITPGGLRPKSQVHLIEKEFDVKLQNGMLLKINKATNATEKNLGKIETVRPEHFISRNILRKALRSRSEFSATIPELMVPISDRWIIYSGWLNNTGKPISYFSTKWIVPPPPATDNGQLIYLFSGIENSAFNIILQPVLQWGNSPAGGGNFWSIANWFVGSPESGIALHGPLVPVNTGDVLQGVMQLKGSAGNKFSYLSSFAGVPLCDLSILDIEELSWANETLECYGLKQFSDYPDTQMTGMTEIDIRTGASQAQVQWQIHNDVTDNGQHCSAMNNAFPANCVNLFYR